MSKIYLTLGLFTGIRQNGIPYGGYMDEYKAKPRVTIGSILEDKTLFPNGFPYEKFGLRKPVTEDEIEQTINDVAKQIVDQDRKLRGL